MPPRIMGEKLRSDPGIAPYARMGHILHLLSQNRRTCGGFARFGAICD